MKARLVQLTERHCLVIPILAHEEGASVGDVLMLVIIFGRKPFGVWVDGAEGDESIPSQYVGGDWDGWSSMVEETMK